MDKDQKVLDKETTASYAFGNGNQKMGVDSAQQIGQKERKELANMLRKSNLPFSKERTFATTNGEQYTDSDMFRASATLQKDINKSAAKDNKIKAGSRVGFGNFSNSY